MKDLSVTTANISKSAVNIANQMSNTKAERLAMKEALAELPLADQLALVKNVVKGWSPDLFIGGTAQQASNKRQNACRAIATAVKQANPTIYKDVKLVVSSVDGTITEQKITKKEAETVKAEEIVEAAPVSPLALLESALSACGFPASEADRVLKSATKHHEKIEKAQAETAWREHVEAFCRDHNADFNVPEVYAKAETALRALEAFN